MSLKHSEIFILLLLAQCFGTVIIFSMKSMHHLGALNSFLTRGRDSGTNYCLAQKH